MRVRKRTVARAFAKRVEHAFHGFAHVHAVQVETLLCISVQAMPITRLEPLPGTLGNRLELGVVAYEHLTDQVGGAAS